MTNYANIHPVLSRSAYKVISLILSWISGLLIGFCFGKFFSVSLTRSVILEPVSVVGLFACVFLPLIITYFSILTNKPIFILIVCFFKAVAFGFSGMLIFRSFGTASWLIQALFLFSDSIYCVVLLFLWFWRFWNVNIDNMRDVFLCAIVGILVTTADYFVISPILFGLV